jgi:hypothetical protein
MVIGVKRGMPNAQAFLAWLQSPITNHAFLLLLTADAQILNPGSPVSHMLDLPFVADVAC